MLASERALMLFPVLVPASALLEADGEVRDVRGGERGPLALLPFDPAPGGGRRFVGDDISFR